MRPVEALGTSPRLHRARQGGEARARQQARRPRNLPRHELSESQRAASSAAVSKRLAVDRLVVDEDTGEVERIRSRATIWQNMDAQRCPSPEPSPARLS
jgi:hypothetical protein